MPVAARSECWERPALATFTMRPNDLCVPPILVCHQDTKIRACYCLENPCSIAGTPKQAEFRFGRCGVNPDASAEVYLLLSDAYYHEPKSEPATALGFLDKYLANPRVAPSDRKRSELLRAEILLSLNKLGEARAVLATLSGDDEFGVDVQLMGPGSRYGSSRARARRRRLGSGVRTPRRPTICHKKPLRIYGESSPPRLAIMTRSPTRCI